QPQAVRQGAGGAQPEQPVLRRQARRARHDGGAAGLRPRVLPARQSLDRRPADRVREPGAGAHDPVRLTRPRSTGRTHGARGTRRNAQPRGRDRHRDRRRSRRDRRVNQTETESLSRTETDMIHRTSPFLPALALAALPLAAPSPNQPPAGRRAVDLAICLDTSGSMQGLIDAARQGIWAIVNDLALAKPAPALRVALLTFGNDRHDAARGWVATQTGFTADLDLVSQKLFALTTDGGTELVGRVLQTALDELDWSTDADALRLVV